MTRQELIAAYRELQGEQAHLVALYMIDHPSEKLQTLCKELDPDNWSALDARVRRQLKVLEASNYGGSAPTSTEKSQSDRAAERHAKRVARTDPAVILDDPAARQAIVDHFAANPDLSTQVIEEAVASDPVIAAAASRAIEKRHEELPKPKPRERSKSDRFTEALTAMRAADAALDKFARAVSGADWSSNESASFDPILDHWSNAIELIRAGLHSGSWDDELAKLTGGL